MATACDPGDLLRSNDGKANFQRLTRLLITGGTALLRELFDMYCPPNDLPKLLQIPAIKNQLGAAKLTKPQRDCVYPSPGVSGKSVEFDLTLLFRLLRALCGLIEPATGWDALPVTSNYSLEADLARIKYYRNSIYGHVSQNMEISDAAEFLSLWKEISEALVRIAGHISYEKKTEWQKAIDNFLIAPLTDEDRRNVEELHTWYRSDVEVKKTIEKLEATTQEMKEQMGELHQSVDQLGKLHQSIDRKLAAFTESPREIGFPQRGYNLWQGGTTRGGPQRGHRGGFVQDSKNTQVYREDEFYDPQGQWFDHRRQRGNQGGQKGGFQGFQSKPKSKLKDRGRDKERDMERVLTRHGEKAYEINQTQLSIKAYREFLEDEDVDLGATATAASESRVIQKPYAKAKQQDMPVDPDVMEYVTSTRFQAELDDSLAGKRKTYLKKIIPNVPEERLILLKKIKFAEKLREKSKELEIKINTESKEIYFEGPQPQFVEAIMKFYKQMAEMVEKKLTLSASILEILNSDKGLQTVECELERNNVEAVVVLEKDVTIVGSSAAHAINAAWLVNKLVVEEKVHVDEKHKHLLKSSEWLRLCGEMNQTAVRVYRNNWNEIYAAGLRDDVTEAIKKLNTFLENECIREESVLCPSDFMRRYLLELRQEDLRTIKNQLKDFVVSIKKGKDDDEFIISGNREGLNRVRQKINALVDSTELKTFEVKQPGLRKFFDSGKGDKLMKSVEKDHDCAIKVQKNLGRGGRDEELCVKAVSDASTSSGDSDDDAKDDHATFTGTDSSTLIIAQSHRVSWKPGNIGAEKADVLVSSQGACDQAIINAGGPQAATPNVGDVTVSAGFSSVSHVIHTQCCRWNNGGGEPTLRAIVQKCLQTGETLGANSIAFPVMGTGNLHFPRDTASRIMLEETVNFCQANPGSNLRDIRFVVFYQDQTLTAAFKQEMEKLQPKPISNSHLTVEVVNGDLTKENNTDAIMNILSMDVNMNNAGDLSKAIARESGPLVQQECNQLGKQPPGTAIMTSGGNLLVPHIIHIIPRSLDKQHLQQCLEEGLRVADANNFQAISIPCVGTGGYGLTTADSAQLTFKALNAFSARCKNIQKVRVVVFQASMMQEYLQEQKKPVQDIEEDSDSENAAAGKTRRRRRRQAPGQSDEHSVRISVIGKDKVSVRKALESLKKGFSDACSMEKVESDNVSQLSVKQKDILRKKAKDRDVQLEIEDDVDRIVVRGGSTEVSGIVGEIWKEINERTKKKQEEEQAKLVSKNVEWTYEIQGTKITFALKANAKIELAHSKGEPSVQVSLRGDKFVIDLKGNSGRGKTSGEQITLTRKVKGADEGIPLPKHWEPMPGHDSTVHKVLLLPSSLEYQDVVGKFQATAGALKIQKIERLQNPHLYRSYMVRKQKMDKDTRGNSERQLFHGTDVKNVNYINAQGFNRSFCGAHGTAYGRGVYFARDAQYSLKYAVGGDYGGRHMYLAKVLVGQYCVGKHSMVVPPPKNPSKPEILYDSVVNDQSSPSIFVVFFDNQCYPEYLITF